MDWTKGTVVLSHQEDQDAANKAEIWLEALEEGIRGDRMLHIVMDLEDALRAFRERLERE